MKMPAHRAQWKGQLKIGEISCAVGLYTSASTSERISFHMINEATGNRLKREFVDSQTEEAVERDQQVKGFETGNGDYIMIDPEEVAAVVPDSDKMLEVEAFIPCGKIDDVYLDKPYYLVPVDNADHDAFSSIRNALSKTSTAAIARTVLFRRMRTVLMRAHGKGIIATTLNFDYEVRPSSEAFKDVAKIKVEAEMLDLAKHIINTKKGDFDPAKFDDRYEGALAALVKAKGEGKPLRSRSQSRSQNPTTFSRRYGRVPAWISHRPESRRQPMPTLARRPRLPSPPRAGPDPHRRKRADRWHRATPIGEATSSFRSSPAPWR